MNKLLPVLKIGQTIAHKVLTRQNINLVLNTTKVAPGMAIIKGFAIDNNLPKKELVHALRFLTKNSQFSVKEAANITGMSVSYAYRLLHK